jgi:hypothetical protein
VVLYYLFFDSFFNLFLEDSEYEVPRPQGGASRQGYIIHIVPHNPAGHLPVKGKKTGKSKKKFFLCSKGQALPSEREGLFMER